MINPLSYLNYICDYADEKRFSEDFKNVIHAEHVILSQQRNCSAFIFGLSRASLIGLCDGGHDVKNRHQVFHGYGQGLAYSSSIINPVLQNVLRNLG